MSKAKYTGKAPPADAEGRSQSDVNRAAMRMGIARKRAAQAKPKEAPPAPLPGWMSGDRTGLPMKPPGKGAPSV